MGKRILSLITLTGVRKFMQNGENFKVRYELASISSNQNPQYRVVYSFGDGKAEAVLIAQNFTDGGPTERLLNLWPGVVLHHRKYGDGQPLTIDVGKVDTK